MTESTSTVPPLVSPHVYVAINQVQGALAKEGIGKTRSNQQQGYKFRGIDDLFNALAPYLAEHNLCILPRILSREVTERVTAKGGVLFYVVIEAEYDFISSLDGSKHTVRVFGEAMDSADKATNKAMSAAYKCACFQGFCIPTEGDNDADAVTHEITPSTPGAFSSEAALITFTEGIRNSIKKASTEAELAEIVTKQSGKFAEMDKSQQAADVAAVNALRQDYGAAIKALKAKSIAATKPTVEDVLDGDSIQF